MKNLIPPKVATTTEEQGSERKRDAFLGVRFILLDWPLSIDPNGPVEPLQSVCCSFARGIQWNHSANQILTHNFHLILLHLVQVEVFLAMVNLIYEVNFFVTSVDLYTGSKYCGVSMCVEIS